MIAGKDEIGNLPIVCIASEPANFWDPEIGIYVPHSSKPDWEIPVNIELFENDGRPDAAFNLKAGIKSTGLYSWQLPEKMLGVSFRKQYGASKLEYPLIFDKSRKVFDTFSIRASGSDWGNTLFRDAMIQSAAVENTNIDNSGFRPCIVFINGEYMGIHNLREKIDEDYIVGNHGLEPGSFDMIEETDAGHYAETGDFKANDYFLSLTAKDLSNPANYQAVANEMDIEDFIDVVATEVYSGNSSIGHNLMKWKPKDSGKWKWILMDFDRGFFNASNQMISFYVNEDGWPLKELIRNQDFKKQFGLKLSDLLFTTFNPTRMIGRIENHKKLIEAEIPRHIDRWKGTSGFGNYSNVKAISTMDYWLSEVNKLEAFAEARPAIILKDLTNYGFAAPVSVTVTTFPEKSGELTFNELKITVDVCAGGYPQGEEIRLHAEAKPGYRFMGWKALGDSVLISKEQVWKYSDVGTDLGNSWKNSGFVDASWKSGQAELGYGDGDEKTVVGYGSDTNNRFITTYFRKSFTLTDKEKVTGLNLALKYDDGAVVYLNGKELQRYNMPSGTINSGTLAVNSVSGTNESTFHTFALGSDLLVNGTNVLAVEIHQSAANSSDISFDLELSAGKAGSASYLSTDSELVIHPQAATNITAVFEGDGKCILPTEISTPTTLSKACSPYLVPDNVSITETGSLTIEPGVELWFSDGVSIASLGPVKAIGTKAEPVVFRSNPESALKRWGNISIKNANDTVWFRNVVFENASHGPNPVRDIAALAVSNCIVVVDSVDLKNVYLNPVNFYNSQTTFTHNTIHSDMPGVDLINVKRGKILISDCDFIGNKGLDSDCIDFGDMEIGSVVRNSYFHDMDGFNSDAVDLGDHSKNILIDGIVAYNIQDKGVSIGQQSSTKIQNSVFINCGMGAGMKDSSSVTIDHSTYYGNFYAIANYQKHEGDAGAHAVVTNSILSNSYESGYLSDQYSAIRISNSSGDTESLPVGYNNMFVNPQFANPALNNFSLLPESPLIGAATDGNIGASLKLPELPVSPMISDIAYLTELGAEDLEFIGLYNLGEKRIVLDSCSFAAGVNYTFPLGTYLEPKQKIYITNNAMSSFWSNRGASVYQWESGRLADEGEKIQLVNKFGKVIDQVIYNNKSPWPVPLTSQYGITLSRFDVDNHFPEYWKLLSVDEIVGAEQWVDAKSVLVYPNPVSGQLTVSAPEMANQVAVLISATGQTIRQIRLDAGGSGQIDVSGVSKGIYLLKIGSHSTKVMVTR